MLLCSPGQQRQKSIAQRRAQHAPQFGAEGAHDPAADHVQAPQEQGNSAHQVKKNDASHRTARLVSTITMRPLSRFSKSYIGFSTSDPMI